MATRESTTKDVALLRQLFENGQLVLAPEFQRNNVWPHAAKAYLIDTILADRPIPLLFFQRVVGAQTGRSKYSVIDGQQRLRAVFEFLDNRVRLTQSDRKQPYFGKRFSKLAPELKTRIYNYSFAVQELVGYSEDNIKDMFIRMNKYVVRLSPQELRHARHRGRFYEFVEHLGKLKFWGKERVFSAKQLLRMRGVEFAAEAAVLLIEGPQDKKKILDLYYLQYKTKFPHERQIENRLKGYLRWIKAALPDFSSTRYRKPVDLYSLIGALDEISGGNLLRGLPAPKTSGIRLKAFEAEVSKAKRTGDPARYLTAASRQTDNIIPRQTRISILKTVILGKTD